MSHSSRYRVVDVFTERPLEGNPLAVFPDASAIPEDAMQPIARELNLSETVFVLPATRDDCIARVRIFTPGRELPFAGHPTIGAGFVLLDEGVTGGIQQFSLEEQIGPVPLRVEDGERPVLWMLTPPITFGDQFDGPACAAALGLNLTDLLGPAPQVVSAGNPMLFIPLASTASVDRAAIDLQRLHALAAHTAVPPCIFVFAPTHQGAYSRMFAPEFGIIEDPATGSGAGPLAAYMIHHSLAPGQDGARFINVQGVRMGRRSILHLHVIGDGAAGGIEVGGCVTPIIEATMTL